MTSESQLINENEMILRFQVGCYYDSEAIPMVFKPSVQGLKKCDAFLQTPLPLPVYPARSTDAQEMDIDDDLHIVRDVMKDLMTQVIGSFIVHLSRDGSIVETANITILPVQMMPGTLTQTKIKITDNERDREREREWEGQ